MRVKGGTVTHRRHKKVLDAAKGYYDRRSKTFNAAKHHLDQPNPYATPPRPTRHSTFRACSLHRLTPRPRPLHDTLHYSLC